MKQKYFWMIAGLAVILAISLLSWRNHDIPPENPYIPSTAAHLQSAILPGLASGSGSSAMVAWLGSGFNVKTNEVDLQENTPPAVTLEGLADRSAVARGTEVHFTAQAVDDGRVERMGIYVNGKALASQEGDRVACTWDTKKLSPGEYIVRATAWDGTAVGDQSISLVVTEATVAANAAAAPESSRGQQAASISAQADTGKYPKLSPVRGSFGRFYYREASGGRIEVDPNWVAENIVTITLPGLNRQVQVHKNARDRFIKAFTTIKNGSVTINGRKVPLLSLIDSMDGTYVTRHVNWNPGNGLSNHSWGAAIDINASDHFRYVAPGDEPYDPNLILWEKAFKPAGFSWGNSYADAMHFELLN